MGRPYARPAWLDEVRARYAGPAASAPLVPGTTHADIDLLLARCETLQRVLDGANEVGIVEARTCADHDDLGYETTRWGAVTLNGATALADIPEGTPALLVVLR
jgi:hypothetical protein